MAKAKFQATIQKNDAHINVLLGKIPQIRGPWTVRHDGRRSADPAYLKIIFSTNWRNANSKSRDSRFGTYFEQLEKLAFLILTVYNKLLK